MKHAIIGACAAPVTDVPENDNLFYHFVLETRCDKTKAIHNSRLGKDHILDKSFTRILAIRVFVKELDQYTLGESWTRRA